MEVSLPLWRFTLQFARNHWYCDLVKNITISLDEKTARWVRVEAACNDMSMSRFIGEVLQQQMSHSDKYERAHQSYLGRDAQRLRSSTDSLPSREEIHRR